MPKIIDIAPAVITAAKVILQAEEDWQAITKKAADGPNVRRQLEADLFFDPTEENLAALVDYEHRTAVISNIQKRIIAGGLNPQRLIGHRLNLLLARPLQDGLEDLEKDLLASVAADHDLAGEYGTSPAPGPRTDSIKARIAVCKACLQTVAGGSASPLKVLARLGYSLDDKVDAEAMSQAALKSVRDTQHQLAIA